MRLFINQIICTELYILVVLLSPIKVASKIPFIRHRMINSGLVKVTKKGLEFSNFYFVLGRTIANFHFYSKVIFLGCGFLPLWILSLKSTLKWLGTIEIIFTSLLLSFGIPFLIIEMYIIKNNCWEKYWKKVIDLSPNRRISLIIISCLITLLFCIAFIMIYISCVPYLKSF